VNDEMTWVQKARAGNDEAFSKLVEAYQTPVYSMCFRMLGEPEAAEDAAQETFLRAYQNLARYDTARPFGTWLLSIAAHYCIDRLRRRRFLAFSLDDQPEDGEYEMPDANAPSPEHETSQREEHAQLHKLLKHLEETDRAALILRYWHDASEVEIAQALGLTVSAVKSRLHRARRELAKRWEHAQTTPGMERTPHESPAF
jgi:RNA polymerase sigma-70 factor, ECF subfamily